jgi:hypothetical protein
MNIMPARPLIALIVVLIIFAGFTPSAPRAQEANSPKLGEVTIYNKEKAFDGFTVFPTMGSAEVHVLGMDGTIHHTWNFDAERARLLPDCSLLVVHMSPWGRRIEEWRALRYMVRQFDWTGSIKWEFEADDVVHHDARKLENGNVIFLGRSVVPEELLKTIEQPHRQAADTRTDSVVEVNKAGEVVWEWKAHEHVDLNYCGYRGCDFLARSEDTTRELDDWTHVNSVQILPDNKWYRAGDSRFQPGNVLIMPRNWWTAVIIDRDTKKIVWEYSGDYRGGIGGGHEPHMIEEGLPGAGNILIFDNGQRRTHGARHPEESFILEINPVTKELVWVYDVGKEFFSNSRGSVQRLPNGNTLISEDNQGRVFEVTPEKEIVWEFRGNIELSRASRHPASYCAKLSEIAKGLKK